MLYQRHFIVIQLGVSVGVAEDLPAVAPAAVQRKNGGACLIQHRIATCKAQCGRQVSGAAREMEFGEQRADWLACQQQQAGDSQGGEQLWQSESMVTHAGPFPGRIGSFTIDWPAICASDHDGRVAWRVNLTVCPT